MTRSTRHQPPPRARRPSAPPERLELYGLHTVEAALRNPERTKHALRVTRNARQRLAEAIAETPDLPIEEVSPRDLDRLLGGDAVHQGCCLSCTPLPARDLDDVASGSTRLVLLDQVSDPHNVGAILRSCAAFAVDAVVTTARHAPAETAVLAKAASGALEHVPIVRVGNLAGAIIALTDQGVSIIGLDSDADADLEAGIGAPPYALVLGAEGKGLRQRTRSLCTRLARLDMPGAIRSLNVSNACALALYAARRGEPGGA